MLTSTGTFFAKTDVQDVSGMVFSYVGYLVNRIKLYVTQFIYIQKIALYTMHPFCLVS